MPGKRIYLQYLNLLGDLRLVLDASLPLLVGGYIGQALLAFSMLVNIGKVDLRAELLGFPCLVDNAVELVNLLESKAFSLVDHEEAMQKISIPLANETMSTIENLHKSDANEAEATPDEKDL